MTRLLAQPDRQPELTPRQWEIAIGQAGNAQLLGRLAQHHLKRGWLDAVPNGPRMHLQSGLKFVDRLQTELRWELDCIRRALIGIPTPVVLLKGAAYFEANLPPRQGRLFGDIDILVERSQLAAVEQALFAAGWISAERDPYNQRYYRQWMHEIPPLMHVLRGTSIDVHHSITPPTSAMAVDSALLLPQIRPAAAGSAFHVLAPVDMVLHSAVHLFQEGEFEHGLRDLLDLRDLLLHFGSGANAEPDFWPVLLRRSHELGLTVALHHALFHIGRLFGPMVPPEQAEALAALRPAWPARTAMAALLGQALRPPHPACDSRAAQLARALLYLRAHALRMPLHLVLPHLVRKAWMRKFPDAKAAVN
ncbi:MAG: nucleotidyltransferase family protein [Rubrivivax sp.]